MKKKTNSKEIAFIKPQIGYKIHKRYAIEELIGQGSFGSIFRGKVCA